MSHFIGLVFEKGADYEDMLAPTTNRTTTTASLRIARRRLRIGLTICRKRMNALMRTESPGRIRRTRSITLPLRNMRKTGSDTARTRRANTDTTTTRMPSGIGTPSAIAGTDTSTARMVRNTTNFPLTRLIGKRCSPQSKRPTRITRAR